MSFQKYIFNIPLEKCFKHRSRLVSNYKAFKRLKESLEYCKNNCKKFCVRERINNCMEMDQTYCREKCKDKCIEIQHIPLHK